MNKQYNKGEKKHRRNRYIKRKKLAARPKKNAEAAPKEEAAA